MDILYVLSDFRPDGAQISTLVLADHLRGRGHRTVIVPLAVRPPDLMERAVALGQPIHGLEAPRLRHQIPELRRFIRSWRPDVVHTTLWNADIAGRLAAAGTGAAVVSSFVGAPNDGADLWPGRTRTPRQQAKRALDAATAHAVVHRFHAISPAAMHTNAAALHLSPARIEVVERGRDGAALGRRTPERRAAARAALGLPVDQPVVLGSGKLDPVKGHDLLIEAMVAVRHRFPDAVLLIAGAERLTAAAALHDAAASLGLPDDTVRLLGHRDDLADLMAAADVYAFPSRLEGGIATAAEALAIGTPLVMARLPAVDGVLVDGEHALLVPPGSAAALADALVTVLEHPDEAARRADAGRRLFEERYAIEGAATRMEALYRAAMARRTRRRR